MVHILSIFYWFCCEEDIDYNFQYKENLKPANCLVRLVTHFETANHQYQFKSRLA